MKNFNMSMQILDGTYVCLAVNTKRMVFRVRKAATGEKGRNGMEKDADSRRKGLAGSAHRGWENIRVKSSRGSHPLAFRESEGCQSKASDWPE